MLLRNKNGQTLHLQISMDDLAWFDESPHAGDPNCICSYCGFVITESEIPIRLFNGCQHPDCRLNGTEARLHLRCFNLLEVKPC